MGKYLKEGKFNVIVGAQAGSEAKGKLSAYICEKEPPSLLVMTASPNAGHTAVLWDRKYVSYHLPIGSVACDSEIVLGPASLINPGTFLKEIEDLGVDPHRILLDSRASIITQGHLAQEKAGCLEAIGSTLQGIGECRTGKMRRDGFHILASEYTDLFQARGVSVVPNTSEIIWEALGDGGKVLCEGTQGFDLDLEHGIDPVYCTSKMINPAMMMAEAGVSPRMVGEIWGVLRPYPIRVNNRTGTSGPYAEAEEIGWDTVRDQCGYPDLLEELTTTTKLPRRVFEFSWSRFKAFVRTCGPTRLCLQFGNYLDWSIYRASDLEMLPDAVNDFLCRLEYEAGIPVDLLGTGPGQEEMMELREEVWA
jgi:adenylosuccinate synthase